MTVRFRLGSCGCVAAALLGCAGKANSSAQGDTTSADAGGTTAVAVTTTGASPVTTTGAAAETTTGAAAETTTGASAETTTGVPGVPAVTITGVSGSGGNTSNSTTGGDDAALGCTGYCEPCPEGQRRFSCDAACLCELDDDVVRDEHERLLACEWEQPCLPADLPAEIFFSANAGDSVFQFSGTECLFAAFRDRTPGRFDFIYDGHAGFGLEYAAYSFLLDGSDNLLSLHWNYLSGPKSGENDQRVFAEVETCTLMDPSVFEACIAAPESCADGNSSATTSKWFAGCVPASEPSCAVE